MSILTKINEEIGHGSSMPRVDDMQVQKKYFVILFHVQLVQASKKIRF